MIGQNARIAVWGCLDQKSRRKSSILSSSYCSVDGRRRMWSSAGKTHRTTAVMAVVAHRFQLFNGSLVRKGWPDRGERNPAGHAPLEPVGKRDRPGPGGAPIESKRHRCEPMALAIRLSLACLGSRGRASRSFLATGGNDCSNDLNKNSCVQKQPVRSLGHGGRNER